MPNGDNGERMTGARLAGGRGLAQPGTRFTATRATSGEHRATVAATREYPVLHQQILAGMIAIGRRHPIEGAERATALVALARGIPQADRTLLHQRLGTPGSRDHFARFFRATFPQTSGRFLDALLDLDARSDPSVAPTASAPAAPKLKWSDVKADPGYLDNFVNEISDAWRPNDRVFIFRYEGDVVAEIGLESLLRTLGVRSELNPAMSEKEFRRRFPHLKDIAIPPSTAPGGRISGTLPGASREPTFVRDPSGLIYPADSSIARTYLPRISRAVIDVESIRPGQELLERNLIPILGVITMIEWSPARAFGALFMRVGRLLKRGGQAMVRGARVAAGVKPKPPAAAPRKPPVRARRARGPFHPRRIKLGAPLPKKLRLYRGSVTGKEREMARTIHPEGDAGAGTYYARDMPTGGHYAQDRRTENVDRLMRGAEPGSGQPATPHGVVRAQDLDTDSVSYLNVSEGPLRAEFEEYMRAVHPETARRIIAGRGSVEVYQDMLYTWAKARAQPIDIDSFQVVALPEYRLGAAQVCVKDAQVVARLHKKSEIVAFATDAPSPRPAAGAR